MRPKPPELLIALGLLSSLFAPLSASAGPYKWQDGSGRVV